MQLNREKCFPSAAYLAVLQEPTVCKEDGWQTQFIEQWVISTGFDKHLLTTRLSQFFVRETIRNALYVAYKLMATQDISVFLCHLQTKLDRDVEIFEKELNQSFYPVWYEDFKSHAVGILQYNDEQREEFNQTIDRHLGPEVTMSNKQFYIEMLFNYYVFLKDFGGRETPLATKNAMLIAFAEQATRCSTGLMVVLNQQNRSVDMPKTLEQLIFSYAYHLVEGVTLRFNKEVDVHQKNHIFAYAKEQGFPIVASLPDPYIVPAFDDFGSIVDDLHVSFVRHYHFYGMVDFIVRNLLDRLTLDFDYHGVVAEKYSYLQANKMYDFLKEFLPLPVEPSTEGFKAIFVTTRLPVIDEEDYVDVKGIDIVKLKALVIDGLVHQQFFIPSIDPATLMTYFKPDGYCHALPPFEDIYQLGYFLRLVPEGRTQEVNHLIQSYFSQQEKDTWMSHVLYLIKIAGDTHDLIHVLSSLHQQYPFTRHLLDASLHFDCYFYEIQHQVTCFEPALKCLSLLNEHNLFNLCSIKHAEHGRGLIARLLAQDSPHLLFIFEQLKRLPSEKLEILLTEQDIFQKNLLMIALTENPSKFNFLFQWFSNHIPQILQLLMLQRDGNNQHLLMHALALKNHDAIGGLMGVLKSALELSSPDWYAFFAAKNKDGNPMGHQFILQAPEFLPELCQLYAGMEQRQVMQLLTLSNHEGYNGLTLAIKKYQSSINIADFVEFVLTHPTMKWFTLLTQKTCDMQTFLDLIFTYNCALLPRIESGFASLSSTERFLLMGKWAGESIYFNKCALYEPLLAWLRYLKPNEAAYICKKVNSYAGCNLLTQLVIDKNIACLNHVLSKHPGIREGLFSSTDPRGANPLMLCVLSATPDIHLFEFLIAELSLLAPDRQLTILMHSIGSRKTLFNLISTLSLSFQKNLLTCALKLMHYQPQKIVHLILDAYANHFENFNSFLKLTDNLYGRDSSLQAEIEHLVELSIIVQLKAYASFTVQLSILERCSKIFVEMYVTKLTLILDATLSSGQLFEDNRLSRMYHTRFIVAKNKPQADVRPWFEYLLQIPIEKVLLICNTLANYNPSINLMLYVIEHFPKEGIQLLNLLQGFPEFQKLIFKRDENQQCVFTFLLVNELIQDKQLILASINHQFLLFHHVFSKDEAFGRNFIAYFRSAGFDAASKQKLFRYNLNGKESFLDDFSNAPYMLDFLLEELLTLPMMSEAEFMRLFDIVIARKMNQLLKILQLGEVMTKAQLQLFLSFLDNQGRADLLLEHSGYLSVFNLLLGWPEQNYQLFVDFLKAKTNLKEGLDFAIRSTQLMVQMIVSCDEVYATRMFRLMTELFTPKQLWTHFTTMDYDGYFPINHLVRFDAIIPMILDYFKSNQLLNDNQLYSIIKRQIAFYIHGVPGAVLTLASYVTPGKQLKLFKDWPLFGYYSSKQANIEKLPMLLERVTSFHIAVQEMLYKTFSWHFIFLQCKINYQAFGRLMDWLDGKSEFIKYSLLKTGALEECVKFSQIGNYDSLERLIAMVKTLPHVQQIELVEKCLENIHTHGKGRDSNGEKYQRILAFKAEIAPPVVVSLAGFFVSQASCSNPNQKDRGPIPK